MRQLRVNRCRKRVHLLLGFSAEPLGMSDIWEIVGGGSGTVAMALAGLERDGCVTARKSDGRIKYELVRPPTAHGGQG